MLGICQPTLDILRRLLHLFTHPTDDCFEDVFYYCMALARLISKALSSEVFDSLLSPCTCLQTMLLQKTSEHLLFTLLLPQQIP